MADSVNEQAEENKQEVQEMTEEEAREKSNAIKDEGNSLFVAKDFEGAIKLYTDAM